jgi:hypothetical protein
VLGGADVRTEDEFARHRGRSSTVRRDCRSAAVSVVFREPPRRVRKRTNAAKWFNKTKIGMSLVHELMLRLEWS